MPIETKEDLLKRIEDLQAQLQEMQHQMAARDALLAQSNTDGWLVTTPNPAYNGMTAGVEFKGGRAFVPVSNPNAEQIVARLVGDFGYNARKMTAQEFQQPATAVS